MAFHGTGNQFATVFKNISQTIWVMKIKNIFQLKAFNLFWIKIILHHPVPYSGSKSLGNQ